MNKRFSRKAMCERLSEMVREYEVAHGFDPTNGWSQVEPRNTTAREKRMIVRAYKFGYYDALLTLWQELS
jgi:hypothetical protein